MKYLFLTSTLMFCLACNSSQQASHDHNSHEHHAHEAAEHVTHDHSTHNHEAEHSAHDTEDEHIHKNGITFNSAQASELDFQISKASKKEFKNAIKASGKISDAQGSEVAAVATVSGIVSFNNTRLTDGTSVRKGQNLVTITSQDLVDDNLTTRISDARMTLELASKNYDRAKELKGDIVSEKELETAETAYTQAKLQYDNLIKGVTEKGKNITAPTSGYIKNLSIKEGQYVSVGETIFEISKNQRIQLTAEVPLKDYDKLRGNLTAKFSTSYSDEVYNLESLNGRVISVGKTTTNNFFIPVTFEFDNKINVIPGSFVEVSVLSDKDNHNGIVIPLTSLVEEQGSYSIYVKICDETYEKRHVIVGNNDFENVVIIEGLHEGEEFVSKGAYFVKLAAMSNVVPHAHNHNH